MSMTTTQESDDALAALGRSWTILLFLGIVSLLLGVAMLVWPGATIVVVAVLLAVWLLISGIFQIVRAFAHGLTGGLRALTAISGAISLILGFVALRAYFENDNALVSGFVLAIFIGISFLFRGLAELMLGISAKGQPGRGWEIFSGIVFIIAGGFVIAVPSAIIALVWVVGIWLIVMGIFEVISAFIVRKAAA